MDNMNEKQYKELINDIAEAVVKLMIKKQAEYDAQYKFELEKSSDEYGLKVGKAIEHERFNTSDEEFMTPQQELQLLEAALEQALDEERYEDVGAIENEIKLVLKKLDNDKN